MRTPSTQLILEQQRRQIKKLDTKANFEKRLADNIKTDSKSFFAYVRERNKTNVKVVPLINGTGEKMEDAHGMADE